MARRQRDEYRRFEETFSLGTLPGETEGDFETPGGLVLARFGHIPAVGIPFEWSGWRFEITHMIGTTWTRCGWRSCHRSHREFPSNPSGEQCSDPSDVLA